jgi:hypothetical protein
MLPVMHEKIRKPEELGISKMFEVLLAPGVDRQL